MSAKNARCHYCGSPCMPRYQTADAEPLCGLCVANGVAKGERVAHVDVRVALTAYQRRIGQRRLRCAAIMDGILRGMRGGRAA